MTHLSHRSAGLVASLVLATAASADVLHLERGGRLEGVLTRETPTQITIDIGMGQVSVPRNTVVRIERKGSALSEYRARLSALPPGDVKALAELARFAADHGLRSEARLLWARVASVDPRNVEAHLALGHVLVGGIYVDEEESFRAKGLVRFDGRWVTPQEENSLLREREESSRDSRRVEEARRSLRDAEDRARRAEADAARAREEVRQRDSYPAYGPSVLVGSPYWGGYTAGCYVAECATVTPIWPAPPPPPVPTPAPTIRPIRPSSIR